jgi:uncharacterized damage-inducible protein DinB
VTIQELRTLLDYHYWARDRVLTALDPLTPEQYTRDLGSSFTSIQDTLGHVYSAEWAWHQRWTGASPTSQLPRETFPDVATVRTLWNKTETDVRGFLEGLGETGINRTFEYKTLAGDPGSSVFWHMLQHVVNHASYHRGQLTTMLRQVGLKAPESMDLIRFYRTHTPRT